MVAQLMEKVGKENEERSSSFGRDATSSKVAQTPLSSSSGNYQNSADGFDADNASEPFLGTSYGDALTNSDGGIMNFIFR